MQLILFYIFASITLLAALGVICFRNTLSSALSLVVCLFGMACLFVLLEAHFLAAMQILVYAGAVMVLFVFVIMLLNLGQQTLAKLKINFVSVVGILFAAYLGILLILKLLYLHRPFLPGTPENFGTIKSVGELLFTQYLVPFEITSLLLLIAVIGSISLAKKDAKS